MLRHPYSKDNIPERRDAFVGFDQDRRAKKDW
jgi:hypothetical protein